MRFVETSFKRCAFLLKYQSLPNIENSKKIFSPRTNQFVWLFLYQFYVLKCCDCAMYVACQYNENHILLYILPKMQSSYKHTHDDGQKKSIASVRSGGHPPTHIHDQQKLKSLIILKLIRTLSKVLG